MTRPVMDGLGVVFQSDHQFFLGTRFQCVRSENWLINQDDASDEHLKSQHLSA